MKKFISRFALALFATTLVAAITGCTEDPSLYPDGEHTAYRIRAGTSQRVKFINDTKDDVIVTAETRDATKK